MRIHEGLTQAVDSRRGVLLVLLDLSAAFDTLDHSTLLCRLRAIGLSQTVLAWFRSYLVGRTKVVKTREVISAPAIIKHGIPQGSVLPRGHGPQSRKYFRMVGNGGPINGCLIHGVTKYSGFQDACVRFSFPVLPFLKILS